MLTTVLCGGTVYFLEREEWADAASYARYVNEQGINTINATPSFFRMLAAVGTKLETLELLHLGGEELTNRTLNEIFDSVGEQCVVYNGYGPTEATINSAIFTVGRRSSRRASVIQDARKMRYLIRLDSVGQSEGQVMILGSLEPLESNGVPSTSSSSPVGMRPTSTGV